MKKCLQCFHICENTEIKCTQCNHLFTSHATEEEIQKIKALQAAKSFKVFRLSEEQWQRFSELFTYNTNAIEGSELNQKEVKDLLEQDKWPTKSKEDIAEAYGVDEAIRFIRETKEHISIPIIDICPKVRITT